MEYTKNYKLPQWAKEDRIMMEDFNEAMANIDTGLTEVSYYIGSYTGNGATMPNGGLYVELGFRPRFLIISKGWNTTAAPSSNMFICSAHPNEGVELLCVLGETGFTVAVPDVLGSTAVKINLSGITYSFLAFR